MTHGMGLNKTEVGGAGMLSRPVPPPGGRMEAAATAIAHPAQERIGQILDVQQVAVILQCSPRSVYRLADAGRMPSPCRLGSLVRWNPAVIEAWIAAGCPACRKGRNSAH